MARFRNRPLRWEDVIGRFEKRPSSEHIHHAQGIIERVNSEGRLLWTEPARRERWGRACNELRGFVLSLGIRREKQDLLTAMREFIQEFEHSTHRMYQMLHGLPDSDDKAEQIDIMAAWFDLIFKASVYALVASWIDDKEEQVHMTLRVDLTTGETTRTESRRPMRVPREYRRATKF